MKLFAAVLAAAISAAAAQTTWNVNVVAPNVATIASAVGVSGSAGAWSRRRRAAAGRAARARRRFAPQCTCPWA
jgi:hypothetical protein